jgi:transposase-like protein
MRNRRDLPGSLVGQRPGDLNNILEQDQRFIKKRINAGLGFRSAGVRTIEGYEAMHAIGKGQIRWLGKATS